VGKKYLTQPALSERRFSLVDPNSESLLCQFCQSVDYSVFCTVTSSSPMRPIIVHPRISTHLCWICGKAVTLEECKVDEYGMPVHDECYLVLILWGEEEAAQKAA
jgi:hypothetical protein